MRTRIIGVAVLASVVAICLFGIPLGVAVYRYAVQEEQSHLARVARDSAVAVALPLWEGYVDPDQLRNVRAGDDDLHSALYDDVAERVAGQMPGHHPGIVEAALGGDVQSDTVADVLVVGVPVQGHRGEIIGAVLVATPRSVVLRPVGLVLAGMAALAAVAVAVAWLVGRRQARRLASPLEELEHSARRLGDGDFSVRSRRGGIPEIDSVGAALDTTAARLDDLLTRERAFSADASHQLRTPLAGLRLRLEAALESSDQDPRPAIAASLADADRLEAIIDELLLLARAGQSGGTRPLDLDALIGELAPEWGARLALHGRDLEVHIDRVTPDPLASAPAVRQVLGVLVDNATMHGRGTVRVSVREAAGAVAVDVSDEGPGLRESETLLFSRRADQRDGHGIGLPLARRLAEAEQGRLELTHASPPVFTLLLPPAVEPQDVAEAEIIASPIHGELVPRTGSGRRGAT